MQEQGGLLGKLVTLLRDGRALFLPLPLPLSRRSVLVSVANL